MTVGIGLGDFGVAKWGMLRALVAASLFSCLMCSAPASAQDATWSATPAISGGVSDFNTAANWNPATVPGSLTQTGTAAFGVSNGTNIGFSSSDTILGGFTFTAGASNYTFALTMMNLLEFTGAGIVVNGGSAAITNSGELQFSNNSTAGNATITNSADLSFGNNSTAGSATITNSGQLLFSNNSTAGNATITNTSQLLFSNHSTAGSSIITNSNGQIQFGALGGTDTSTAGTATITNNHGTISFNASSTAGTATITNTNVGATFFANNSTAGNATITNTNGETGFQNNSTAGNARITNNNGGIIEFFDVGSSAGNATITNNSGGQLIFSHGTAANATIINSGTATITNTATGGNARLINNAGGQFFINANGPTLTAGSIEGAGTFAIDGGAQLTVGTNNLSTTVSGVISGSGGSLTKIGTGTLTLTGTNTYSGTTIVNGGTLEVDGSIASSPTVTVNSGGMLTGTGTVDAPLGSTTINAGGTLAPGTPGVPGTLMTIGGNLVFQPGATYAVSLNPSATTSAVVVGTATLAGTVSASFAPGSYAAHQYDILHSAGLGGTTFAGLTTNNPNFATSLSYTATDVLLNLTAATLGNGTSTNGNQRNVAGAINGFFNNGGTLPPGFGTLFGLTGNNLSSALSQVSGETATGSQQTTFDAMSQFMGLLTDPFMNRGGGANPAPGATGYADEASAYAANKKTDAFAMFTKAPRTYEPRWSVWVSGFGGSQSTSGNTAVGTNNTTSSIAATAVGADYLFSPNTIVGFAVAGGGTNFSVANGGTGRSDLFQAGAYIRHWNGPAYVSAALAYGWQDITTNRTVTAAGFDQLRAEFNANAWSGRVEGGYRFVSPVTSGIGITPYAAAQFVTFDLPAYAEQSVNGLNTFALTYGAHEATDPRSEIGFRTDKSWAQPDGILTLRGRLAWAHDFDPNRAIAATFQSLPGASFVVNGAAQAADSALTTVSIEKKWTNGWSAAATFEGEFSRVTASYAGKGVVRYQW